MPKESSEGRYKKIIMLKYAYRFLYYEVSIETKKAPISNGCQKCPLVERCQRALVRGRYKAAPIGDGC